MNFISLNIKFIFIVIPDYSAIITNNPVRYKQFKGLIKGISSKTLTSRLK